MGRARLERKTRKKIREITERKQITVVWETDGAAAGRVIEGGGVGVV